MKTEFWMQRFPKLCRIGGIGLKPIYTPAVYNGAAALCYCDLLLLLFVNLNGIPRMSETFADFICLLVFFICTIVSSWCEISLASNPPAVVGARRLGSIPPSPVPQQDDRIPVVESSVWCLFPVSLWHWRHTSSGRPRGDQRKDGARESWGLPAQ